MKFCTILMGMLLIGFWAVDLRASDGLDALNALDGVDLTLDRIADDADLSQGETEPIRAKKQEAPLEKLGLEFYGHFKLDAAYDTAETQWGETAFFTKYYDTGEKDEEFTMHARHTRFGLRWYGEEVAGIKAFGNFEIDFLGKADQRNTETMQLQAEPRMRHAYMRFDFEGGWSFWAGQTWDVFGPINMAKLNTLVGWGQGNVAFRRGQLRIQQDIKTGEKSTLTWAFALADPVSRDKGWDDDVFQDDGEDAGMPDFQGHVGMKMPFMDNKPIKFGLGGAFGKREVSGNGTNLPRDRRYDSWIICGDLKVPILDQLELIGEVWQSEGSDGYRSGVWQAYTTDGDCVEEVKARGYFVNAIWKPVKKWRFVGGYGVDSPYDYKYVAGNSTSFRKRNTTLFGNVMYTFYPKATVGLEVDRMATDYPAKSDRVNHRIQMSFMLKF